MKSDHDSPPPEHDLGVFIGIVRDYFTTVGGSAAELLNPTLEWITPARLDTTGYIPVAGGLNGWIGVSLPDSMLRGLLERIGEPRHDDEACRDFAAEMTSVITGNARAHFGPRLRLSPPVAARHDDPPPDLPQPRMSLKLPFRWQGDHGFLLVACTS